MPDGEAILLLHGFTNTHRCWRRLRDAGLGDHYQVIAPDIRGHGDAGDARPVTLEAVLDDIDALAPERVTLLGYSQGGRIALHAALDPRLAPRISQLILISASPGIADPAQRARRRRADEILARDAEAMTIAEFAARWSHTPVLAGLPGELRTESYEDRLHSTTQGLAAALRGLGTAVLPSLWDRLHELEMRVTLIAGARDTKFTELADEMARLIPEPQVEIVAGAGHQVHLEKPAAVVAAVLAGRQLSRNCRRSRHHGVAD